jgi:hypothetical protein
VEKLYPRGFSGVTLSDVHQMQSKRTLLINRHPAVNNPEHVQLTTIY